MAVGATGVDLDGNPNGHVRVYERDGTNWLQVGPTLFGDAAIDQFGAFVSLNADGTRMAVSSPSYGPFNKGQVKVLDWDGASWVQVGQALNGDNPDSQWGRSKLNDNGDILAVTGPGWNGPNLPGVVRVYQFDGAMWQQMGSDFTNNIPLDDYGVSISLAGSGKRLAIGTSQNWPNPGFVEVFDWDGAVWQKVGSTIFGTQSGSGFGRSIDISNDGSIVAVGAYLFDGDAQNAGQTSVFLLDDGEWKQIGDPIEGKADDDISGEVVELSPDGLLLAVSSPWNDENGNNAGHVRVFEFTNDNWSPFPDVYMGDVNDGFARSLSFSYLDESTDQYVLAMSTPYHDVPFFQGGGVRTFAYVTEPIMPANADETHVTISPNPATHRLTVETGTDLIQSITILNETTGENLIEVKEKSVDISKLFPGRFIVIVKLGSGKIHTERIIVQ